MGPGRGGKAAPDRSKGQERNKPANEFNSQAKSKHQNPQNSDCFGPFFIWQEKKKKKKRNEVLIVSFIKDCLL